MNSAFIHVESDQEDWKVKASNGQLDKWVWSPRQETQIGMLTAHNTGGD